MKEEFKKFLLELGATINDNTDAIISFEYKELSYLFFSEEDDYYIRLILPRIYEIDKIEDQLKLYQKINKYNVEYKAIKMSVIDNFVWLSVEQFIYSRENAGKLFGRLMYLLDKVISKFREDE